MARLSLVTTTAACGAVVVALGCAVSEDEEVALGVQTAREIEAQLPLVTDPAIDGWINALGDSIAHLADDRGLEWEFRVVNSPQINAFAVPGGFVYVNRGLIERTEKLDELTGVLGHEIAHVTERHSAEQLESSRTTNVGLAIVCTLTSICESEVARVAINVGGSAFFARHSRQDESEADSVGIEYVVRAGFDPRGIPDFFERLLAERRDRPALVEGWFGTHPLEEDRIREARRQIEALGPGVLETLTRDAPGYREFRARVEQLPPSPLPPAGP